MSRRAIALELFPSPPPGAERVGVRWGIACANHGIARLTLPVAGATGPLPLPPQAGGEGKGCADCRLPHDAAPPLQSVQRADHRRVLCADGARPVADPQSLRRDQFRPWRIPGDRRLSRLHADPVYRLLGRAGARAGADGGPRPRRRARADPPALRPRSALQPAAHLRPRLHPGGRDPLHLGRGKPAFPSRPGCRARSAASSSS